MKIVAINLDKERHLNFNLNALIKIEELTGKKIQEVTNEGFTMSLIRTFVYAGLRFEDKTLTLEDVGDMIDMGNMTYISEKIGEALEGLK